MDMKSTAPGVIETQLRAWGAELDRLKAKAERQLAETRTEYYEHLEELRDDIEGQLRRWGKEIEGMEPRAEAQKVVQELRATIESQLRQWAPEIEALKSRAGTAEAEAKRLIDEIRTRRKALKERLSELKHATGGAWEDVKTGSAKAWEELKPALQSAISKFK